MAVTTFADPELGEVRSETGIGHVVEFTHEAGKRNAYVKIAADGLKHPLGGWIDTHTAPKEFLAVAAVSLGEGRRVRYRIDVHRKESIKADGRTLEQLDKTERVRDLVALELFLGTGNDHERTSDATRPQTGGAVPNATTGAPPPAKAEGAAVATDAGEIPPPSDADAPPGEAQPRRGPKVMEGKPWEADNSDGSPNLGSYEVVACVAMVEWAWELLMAHALAENLSPPTVKQARGLGTHLLFCADRVQATIRPDGRVDRMASSHTRARGAVRSAVEVHGPPWGKVGEPVTAWRDAVTTTATELLQAGVALLMEFEK